MKQLHNLFLETYTHPERSYESRAGGTRVDVIALNGTQFRYPLSDGFPLASSKPVSVDYIATEQFSFMAGETNIRNQVLDGLPFWIDDVMKAHYAPMVKDGIAPPSLVPNTADWRKFRQDVYLPEIRKSEEFAEKYGNFKKGYWHQWRRRLDKPDGTQIDQLQNIVDGVRKSPRSRRLLLSAWNPVDLDQMPLPPCHIGFHVLVRNGKLDLIMDQRSGDEFLGVPYNIAGYAFITKVLAAQTGLEPGTFIHNINNGHIYCGKDERGAWYGKNLDRLREKVLDVKSREDYRGIAEWIENEAPPEFDEHGNIVTKDAFKLDHVPAILEMLAREPNELPRLDVEVHGEVTNMTYRDMKNGGVKFKLHGYDSHPEIRRAMAVSEAVK